MRADPINRLRRMAALLEAAAEALKGTSDVARADTAWLAAAIRRYDEEAPTGITLEDTLDLSPTAPGAAPWWRREAQRRRDEAIRRIREQCFADLEVPRAAKEIAALAARFQHAARVATDKKRPEIQIGPEAARLLTDALCTGRPFPGPKQVQNILEIK